MGTLYSAEITNLRNSPPGMAESDDLGGHLRVATGFLAVGTADIDAGDILVMTRLPSNASIKSIVLYNTDVDADATPTIAADVGLYLPDGTAVDVDLYADGVTTLQAANLTGSDVRFQDASTALVSDINNKIWEDLGLTADPHLSYDLAITIATVAATAAAGTVAWKIEYTNG